MLTLRPKNPRHASVMETTLVAFDNGMRGGDLIAVAVDKIDEVRTAEDLPPIRTENITMLLLEAALGDDRAVLEKALYGFNI